MSLNTLYVIICPKSGSVVSRIAYTKREHAEAFIKGTNNKYRIERYVPAPLKVVSAPTEKANAPGVQDE